MQKTINEVITETLAKPEISYLFGYGSTNQAVVDAFKTEFYNAFKHRLAEAVEAEHEANYDYWWLSFFPKAIPLGDKSLQGQSIIEVGFGESIVPEEQYHRWLQDKLFYSESDKSKNEDDEEYERKIRLATSVLNDFMIVLDSSDLSEKYPKLRSDMIYSLNKFANSSNTNDSSLTRYYKGIKISHITGCFNRN